ncbi:RagB/SusD family nutrient uptake outer membrane protein [Puteibacter caeruleilacunae]|nr:RagB/SusD family nutrient uptake outer membrane protein [Puteibacter caeruleilacunae]
MKLNMKYQLLVALSLLIGFSGCNDYLDREPLDKVTPENYLKAESDLAAYTINRYSFPTHGGWGLGTFRNDNGTDNQASSGASNIWNPGQYRVGEGGGSWNFSQIRQLNYFFEQVLPRWKADEIKGDADNINHYIGEAYFLRAYEYFNRIQALGDFPIIKTTLPDKPEELTEASKRRPRNEVARFIIADLDSAIMLMKNEPPFGKNRLSKHAAQLFKSRVALHEGTWLKYHKGTNRVPGGPGWPGASADYLSGFSVNIDSEIDFFLTEAMEAAKAVTDDVDLTANNGATDSNVHSNPYFQMFGDLDMEGYDEVLFWRGYNSEISVGHHTMHYLRNGGNSGYTRSFVETFLMDSGLPIYDAASGYAGDDSISMTQIDRDPRLKLFMKTPGDTLTNIGGMTVEEYPDILDIAENRYVTGYSIKKGINPDNKFTDGANLTTTGSIVFRAVEAYLNYIEADYVKNGSLNGTSQDLWTKIRTRAGVDTDFNKTITATNLSLEKDWARYSGGNMIDATLYNIRRERRCELIAEGFRMMDLKRWRALDQVQNYQIEGFKIWGPMKDWFVDDEGASTLKAEPESSNPNVSPEANSMYLRPYQIRQGNNDFYNGYNWHPAHYLSPIAYEHFLITSQGGDVSTSVIYQNPGWPVEAGAGPTE